MSIIYAITGISIYIYNYYRILVKVEYIYYSLQNLCIILQPISGSFANFPHLLRATWDRRLGAAEWETWLTNRLIFRKIYCSTLIKAKLRLVVYSTRVYSNLYHCRACYILLLHFPADVIWWILRRKESLDTESTRSTKTLQCLKITEYIVYAIIDARESF